MTKLTCTLLFSLLVTPPAALAARVEVDTYTIGGVYAFPVELPVPGTDSTIVVKQNGSKLATTAVVFGVISNVFNLFIHFVPFAASARYAVFVLSFVFLVISLGTVSLVMSRRRKGKIPFETKSKFTEARFRGWLSIILAVVGTLFGLGWMTSVFRAKAN